MLGARLSATEWVEGGFSVDEGSRACRALKAAGAGLYLRVLEAGTRQGERFPPRRATRCTSPRHPARGAGIATRAVGLIDRAEEAEAIVAEGRADLVALARAILADPRWPWRAAAELGHELKVAPQLLRAAHLPKKWAAAA